MTDNQRQTAPVEQEGPPPYDADAVGRIAKRIQIEDVQLLGLIFQRADDSPLPDYQREVAPDELAIGVEWKLAEPPSELGCALTFAAHFESDPPYELVARFGLRYAVKEGPPLADEDLEQFAHWNAVFNAWPFWRELASTTIARTDFDRFVVPVMPVPRERQPGD